MEPEESPPCSHQLTIYPRRWARSIQSLNINLLSSHQRPGHPNDLFTLGLATKTLYAVYSFAIRATCLITSPREHYVRSAEYAIAHYVIPVSSLSVSPSAAPNIEHPQSMSFPERDQCHGHTDGKQICRHYVLTIWRLTTTTVVVPRR